ncbi:SIMPL domain-containing protein [Mangrovivirga sp. M17]|uniref:SIMPL domain-containing protein n=1 Tax=Mangrovivirga halotolerans TaxID=2993936 RepID=A0ABT3RQ91_9BACT|nr:SIMPL domain-containing protein [Mangrovivirga halotolerans]MCX2743963.1 SIMPL domain-containing protein [Mangrovivirga halotolerans]
MKKLIKYCFLVVLFFGSTNAYSQDNMSKIIVKGNAEIETLPDETTVRFDILSKKMNYADAVDDLNKRINILVRDLSEQGFDKKELKTSNFRVNKNVVYNRGTRTDSGYVGTQSLEITFNFTKEKLLNAINTGTGSEAEPEISISFGLSKEKRRSLEDELIKSSVNDARLKAEVLAESSGVEIGKVMEIRYGINENNFPQPMRYEAASMRSASMDQSNETSQMNPDNITLAKEVIITFEIVQ